MSKDLIPISATGQGSISNDMEIGASINGDTSIDHHSSTAKCDTSMYKCRIVLNATFPSDKNTPVIRMNKKKMGLVIEYCTIRFFSSSQALLSTPCRHNTVLLLT